MNCSERDHFASVVLKSQTFSKYLHNNNSTYRCTHTISDKVYYFTEVTTTFSCQQKSTLYSIVSEFIEICKCVISLQNNTKTVASELLPVTRHYLKQSNQIYLERGVNINNYYKMENKRENLKKP